MRRPLAPGGVKAASASTSFHAGPPTSERTHSVKLPAVDIPAASVRVPISTPCVVQSSGLAVVVSPTRTMKIVDPYITIRSPSARTPTLNASAQASMVPATTGVPGGSPVSSAAAVLTTPTCWLGQASGGGGTPFPISDVQSYAQSPAARS